MSLKFDISFNFLPLHMHWFNLRHTNGAPYLHTQAQLKYAQTFANFSDVHQQFKISTPENVANNIINHVVVLIIWGKEPNSEEKALFERSSKLLLTYIGLLRNLFLDMRS